MPKTSKDFARIFDLNDVPEMSYSDAEYLAYRAFMDGVIAHADLSDAINFLSDAIADAQE